MHPEKQFFTSGKYEGSQKWTLIWDEKQYALWQDMMNAEKFNFVFDNCWGISDEMNGICEKILFDPIFSGESWMQLSAEYSPVIDSMIIYGRQMCPILWDTPSREYVRFIQYFNHPKFIASLVGIADKR